ncbi:MAG TPA: hypothetical protein VM143_00355 [Acidimicrobiales bacterium]|nr:hypothetical protein [Acidimicrobiales bacterium]
MRLQQLALRVSGDGQWLRFHERLTVISGIRVEDRQGVVEVILGTLAGEATVSSELAYVGRTGQRVTVDQTAEGTFHTFHDDGTPTTPPSVQLGLSVQELFGLMYVDARQLGILKEGPPEPKELLDARAALAALTDQLEAAQVARDATESFRLELLAIDEEIRQIDLGRPRRRYARLLLELDRLKLERDALSSSPAEAEADRTMASHLALLRPIAARWRAAARRLSDASQAFGEGRVRLDPHSLAGALTLPEQVPLHLDSLVDELAAAEAQRATISARLAGLMASHLESPSQPDVARLARAEQHRLWQVAQRAIETGAKLEAESIALGGLVIEHETEKPAIVQEVESAHAAVEQAEEVIEKRRMGVVAAGGAAALGAMALPLAPFMAPLALAGSAAAAYWSLFAPRQQLAEAQGWETDALIRAGVPSYLSFHLRRMEALKDPTLRLPLERAAQLHREAMAEWRLLAGDMSPVEAVALEDEVRRYAASVEALDGLGDEITETRLRLTDEVEPLVEAAREALMDVCRPFGIEHPTLAADLVRQLAEVARVARLQAALESAESEDAESRALLEDMLGRLGYGEGELSARVTAFEERAMLADQRVRDRTMARSIGDVNREIERLEALARTEHRPEFGMTFTTADANEPDPEALQARRELTATAYHMANRLVPDVRHIADRRSALERRVAVLEERHGGVGVPSTSKVEALEQFLHQRLDSLRSCGAEGEALPLILDECFLHLPADAKWTMLDLVDRLSGGAQVIYLTDDPDVSTWARRRSATGAIAFLDPLREPASYGR